MLAPNLDVHRHWSGFGFEEATGRSVLHLAATVGDVLFTHELLYLGADPDSADKQGVTPLFMAMYTAAQVVDPRVVTKTPQYWTYWISNAELVVPNAPKNILTRQSRIVRALIEQHANVNQTHHGLSLLELACRAKAWRIVSLLLEHGANANAARAGFSPLHAAIMRRDEPMVRALLAHGADANFSVTSWTPTRRSSRDYHFSPELVGATPFWLAARFGGPAVMRLLLEHGADPWVVHRGDHVVEGRGGSGFQHRVDVTTAMMAAVGMGGGEAWIQPERADREALALEAVTLAAELGIDVNAANLDGRTALDAAKALKYETVVRFLVYKGGRTGTK